MTPKSLRTALVAGLAAAALIISGVELTAEDKALEKPVSAYAPASVLIEQLEEFQQEFEEIVADPDEYASKAGRINRHGHAMAVIALALALHDEDHELKASAPAVLEAVQAAAATEQLEAAQAAVAEIRQAIDGGGDAEIPESWSVVAPMGMLMKQVSFMHTRMGRGARGRRFESRARRVWPRRGALGGDRTTHSPGHARGRESRRRAAVDRT